MFVGVYHVCDAPPVQPSLHRVRLEPPRRPVVLAVRRRLMLGQPPLDDQPTVTRHHRVLVVGGVGGQAVGQAQRLDVDEVLHLSQKTVVLRSVLRQHRMVHLQRDVFTSSITSQVTPSAQRFSHDCHVIFYCRCFLIHSQLK